MAHRPPASAQVAGMRPPYTVVARSSAPPRGNPRSMARTPHLWPPEDEPGPHVRLTNADKVLSPVTGTTKEEVFGYYTSIAEHMLAHIAGRPATRKRWPNGVEEASFFEKQLAESAPAWVNRATIEHRSGATTYPTIDSPAALAWIAQQAALEVHVPQWRFIRDEPLARRAESRA